MNLFEGKTSTEKKKIIVAGALCVVSLIALYLAFGRSFFGGSSTTASTKASPTPTPGSARANQTLPTASEQAFVEQTTAVVYGGPVAAPDPGRNIFAFYEPPKPCQGDECPPTPIPTPPPPKPASPMPTPHMLLSFVNPQSVYAGQRGFKLEVTGERFEPNAQIYFNQSVLPTTFINGQKLTADIPANLIAQEGVGQVIVQTPDGKYSDQVILNVQAPPKPTFLYIGMIARARGNNDTGVFERPGKSVNFSHRLNDIIDRQFRLIGLSREEAVFEDVNLGFKHRIPISKLAPGTSPAGPGPPIRGGGAEGFQPFDPGAQKDIPGIPNNIPRYVPPAGSQPKPDLKKSDEKKEAVDDNAVDDGTR